MFQDRRHRSPRARAAHERNTRPVGTPAGRAVPRCRGGDPADRRSIIGEDADKGVIAAIRGERQARPVGGPPRVARAAGKEETLSRGGPIDRDGHHLSTAQIGDHIVPRRDHRFVSVGEQLGCSPGKGHRPDLYFERHRHRRRVRGQLAPVGAVLSAPHVYHPLAIIADLDRGQLLPVIHSVGGELASGERRTFGNPDISKPALVECPDEALPGGRGGELIGKRKALDLRHRVARGRGGGALGGGDRGKEREGGEEGGGAGHEASTGGGASPEAAPGRARCPPWWCATASERRVSWPAPSSPSASRTPDSPSPTPPWGRSATA